MNSLQKKILVISSFLILLLFFFPPSQDYITLSESADDGLQGQVYEYFTGFNFIFSLQGSGKAIINQKLRIFNGPSVDEVIGSRINLEILVIGWVAVLTITTMLVIAFKDKSRNQT